MSSTSTFRATQHMKRGHHPRGRIQKGGRFGTFRTLIGEYEFKSSQRQSKKVNLLCRLHSTHTQSVDDVTPNKRKRQRKIEVAPKTSTESDLREQSMVSLLELIRADKEEPPTSNSAIQQVIEPIITQETLPRPPTSKPKSNPQKDRPNVCEICVNKRLKVSLYHDYI
jgi:hypothetical protein